VAPSFDRAEADALDALNRDERRVAIGLHLTLTAPFRPLTPQFAPLQSGAFLPLEQMLLRGAVRALRRDVLAAEVARQIESFVEMFGRPPDFIDGHQHVHLFPRVREAALASAKGAAPDAWVRQCGRAGPLSRRLADRKGLVLDMLSRRFRAHAAELGVATNPAFAGTYDFEAEAAPDFARMFAGFLDRLPAQSVVMCHPGFVDAELTRLDPLTDLREREHEFFAGDAFPALLAAHGVTLARQTDVAAST
jgi:predicted glycoside hydrolase/deacetylase ChbG (UPF0249 family)